MAGAAHKEFEDPIFRWSEVQIDARARYFMGCRIEHEIVNLQPGFGWLDRAAGDRTQTGKQNPKREGLGKVIVGARVKTPYDVASGIARSEHQNRGHPSGGSQPADQIDTVHTRHQDIQKNRVEIAGFSSVDSLQ